MLWQIWTGLDLPITAGIKWASTYVACVQALDCELDFLLSNPVSSPSQCSNDARVDDLSYDAA